GLDLPVAQRRRDRLAGEVHEGRRLQQPDIATADASLGDLAEQLAVQSEPRARLFRQRVNKPEPGVVPGPGVFGTGIAQPDDEAQACHRVRHPSDPRRRDSASRRDESKDYLSSFFAALVAGTSAASGAASSVSSLPCLAITTATSCSLPSFSSGI